MKKLRQLLSQRWRGALIGALLGMTLASGAVARFGRGFVRMSFDIPFRFRKEGRPSEVVMIYMDDKSHETLKQPYGSTWSRKLHAELLDRLTKEKAELVVYDIIFTQLENETEDNLLAQAIARNGRVILSGVRMSENESEFEGDKVNAPDKKFRDAALGWGLANFDEDADRGVRFQYLGTEDHPALAWVAAKAVKPGLSSRSEKRWMNYYGPPAWLPSFSFETAVGTNLAPGAFTKKVVFIGAHPTATVMGSKFELFGTPYTRFGGRSAPGVEIHATSFLNLIRNESLSRMPVALELGLLAGLAGLMGAGLVLLTPTLATVTTAAVWVLFGIGSLAAIFATRTWFGWVNFLLLQAPAVFAWSLVYNSVRLHIEKRLLHQALKLHLSPSRVDQILARPELLKAVAEKQEITIMFTDIAGFSKLTARLEAEDLFRLLNRYFDHAIKAVHDNDGTVIKFIGDSIFAIWNAPFVQPHQQYRACSAALALQKSILQLEQQALTVSLRTRIGLHTGHAYVGNVGSSDRFDYSAIGDSVNLASRLESLNKHLGTDILATRDLHKIIEERVTARRVGFFKLAGFDRIVEVYQIIGGPEVGESTCGWRARFEEALFAFNRRDWAAAEAAFRDVLNANPNDGPTNFYIDRMAKIRDRPLDPTWFGEIDMDEK